MSEPIVESAKRRATRFQIQKRSQDHKLQHKKKNLCILRIKEKINFPLHRLHQSKISVDKKGFYQGIETAGSLGHKERKSTRREDIDRTRIEKKPSYDTIYCPEGQSLSFQTPTPPLSSIPCVTPSSTITFWAILLSCACCTCALSRSPSPCPSPATFQSLSPVPSLVAKLPHFA